MPNPVPRKYTVQLGPTFTPDVAGELAAWADQREKSVSELTREAAELGLKTLRRRWEKDSGPLDAATLARHIEAAAERGEKQAARRTKSDRARRNADAA